MKHIFLVLFMVAAVAAETITCVPEDVPPAARRDVLYDAWTVERHLIMSDNATPDNLDDDWIVDWEWR